MAPQVGGGQRYYQERERKLIADKIHHAIKKEGDNLDMGTSEIIPQEVVESSNKIY